jgi:hypothetical protein
MHRIRVIGRLTALLAGLAGLAAAWAASGATPALATMNRIPDGDNGSPQLLPISTVTRTLVAGGMPGWQIALIAAGAAAAAAIVAVLLDRTRAARQPVVTGQRLAVSDK